MQNIQQRQILREGRLKCSAGVPKMFTEPSAFPTRPLFCQNMNGDLTFRKKWSEVASEQALVNQKKRQLRVVEAASKWAKGSVLERGTLRRPLPRKQEGNRHLLECMANAHGLVEHNCL
jgi:hypothetical protein